jgi:hypothetical protein
MFVRGLLTPEAEGLAIVRTLNCSLAILLYVVKLWHMALTTDVDVAARPGRVGAFAVDAGLVMRVRVVRTAADGAGTGALVCGWPTGRVSADSSSKRMPSQRRLRMPPRRTRPNGPASIPTSLERRANPARPSNACLRD